MTADPNDLGGGWRRKAACRGCDPDKFFPVSAKAEDQEPAKQICRGCPVREECLEWAVATRQQYGIWGGHTTNGIARRRRDRIRKQLARARQRANPIKVSPTVGARQERTG